MYEDRKLDAASKGMPAPQLPNIPISPDDPFQSDPDLLPPVAPAHDSDPAPGGGSPGGSGANPPADADADDLESEPDDPETA
jgi:hypothetical protein